MDDNARARVVAALPHAHTEATRHNNNNGVGYKYKPVSSSTVSRRCQSANVSSRRTPRPSSHTQYHTLKNPQDKLQLSTITEALPIPSSSSDSDQGQSSAKFTNGEGENNDKGDLTRMYDYATWNMYERIVSARRCRLSAIDSSSSGEEEAMTMTTDGDMTRHSSAPNVTKLHAQIKIYRRLRERRRRESFTKE